MKFQRAQCNRCLDKLGHDPERIAKYRLKTKAKALGLDPEQVWKYYVTHAGRCDICSEVEKDGKRLAIDHCHVTGEFRGLLCSSCNKGLGLFRDSPELLSEAVLYLLAARRVGRPSAGR